MKELIEFMARAIVENPDAVEVTEEDDAGTFVYYLKVADEDMGRVIGKQGRIANAMRTMLKVAAIRRGVRAVLEIGDARSGRGGPGRGGYSDRGGYDRGASDDADAGYDSHQQGSSHDDDAGYDAVQADTSHEDSAAYDEPHEDSSSLDEHDLQPEDQGDQNPEYREEDRDAR